MEAYLTNLLTQTVMTVAASLVHNWLPLSLAVLTASVMSVYIKGERIQQAILKSPKVSIAGSVAVGAFTPFCACGTMAVVIGMLTTTLPWGPVMAFLTSSPLMSPDGFIMLAGIIGLKFAVALTLASLIIGLGSGFITHWIEKKTGFLKNQTRFVQKESAPACGCGTGVKTETTGKPRFLSFIKWREIGEALVNLGLKQILLFFSIFVAVGYLINTFIPTSVIMALFSGKNPFAVPLAALIGLPLYVTTESSVPLIKALTTQGASGGATLAFMITGQATSAWVIAGIATFLKRRAIGLYLVYIMAGGIFCGYLYDLYLTVVK